MTPENIQLKHLCTSHRLRISNSERDALSLWAELFQRGAKSYVDCRSHCAKIYLRAAIEVTIVRMQSFKNEYFNHAQLSRPMYLLDHIRDQFTEEDEVFFRSVRELLIVRETQGLELSMSRSLPASAARSPEGILH
jgi:hypothetical protein